MNDKTDALHQQSYIKRYDDYLDEITAQDLYEGLVGYGMFGDKLPPILSSAGFLNYCLTKNHSYASEWQPWITYRYMRNVNRYRTFGIPNPFGYELLAAHLRDNWDAIRDVLKANTSNDPYEVSRIHLRKMQGTKSLFKMNYHNQALDYNPLPAVLVGKRYLVKCDVSTCFPSIYTHAVEWAIRGKVSVKSTSKHNKSWTSKLDRLLSNTTNGETHGILIGPHASNLISELILTAVDRELLKQGFRFQRWIDDYDCYADTHEQAEEFILSLDEELQQYNLTLNQKKTAIIELPYAATPAWIRKLRQYKPQDGRLSRLEISSFIDSSIELMNQCDADRAVLLYALRILCRHPLTATGRQYYFDEMMHLVCLYPYLMPHVDDVVIGPSRPDSDRLAFFLDLMYEQGLSHRDFLTATFSLYYSLRYNVPISQFAATKDTMLQSGDCLLWLYSWLYASSNNKRDIVDDLHQKAVSLSARPSSFGKNWLFVYTALNKNDFTKLNWSQYAHGKGLDNWKEIKNKGVSFIDWNAINSGTNNMRLLEVSDI